MVQPSQYPTQRLYKTSTDLTCRTGSAKWISLIGPTFKGCSCRRNDPQKQTKRNQTAAFDGASQARKEKKNEGSRKPIADSGLSCKSRSRGPMRAGESPRENDKIDRWKILSFPLWRSGEPNLPNNNSQAEKRLRHGDKRLSREADRYQAVHHYVSKGCTRRLSDDEGSCNRTTIESRSGRVVVDAGIIYIRSGER